MRMRRLQRCYDLLTSPVHQTRSITEIAYSMGFSSSSHSALGSKTIALSRKPTHGRAMKVRNEKWTLLAHLRRIKLPDADPEWTGPASYWGGRP
jgi:hypothetical protein